MPEPSEGADAEPEQRDVDSVPIGIIASREFMCARVDVPVRAVESVVPPEPWALPIVDMHGRFFGFISKTLLAASDLPPRLALAVPAMQIASGSALAVHETCSLRCAIHAMAIHGTRIIAILDASGDLRGVLTDIEALRAIANETSTFRLG
jgi:predicted transcriptional regulator